MIVDARFKELEKTIATLTHFTHILSKEICTCYETMTRYIEKSWRK